MRKNKGAHQKGKREKGMGHEGTRTVDKRVERENSRLEIVLKCDSSGSEEAVLSSLQKWNHPQLPLVIIRSGIGAVTKSDLLMARTGSRLVVGFNVEASCKIDDLCKEEGIEVRRYDVIYKLMRDVNDIGKSLVPQEVQEKVTGSGKVMTLFPSRRGGIIAGCQVEEGSLEEGKPFRVISAMGPVYRGRIESLRIEQNAVRTARPGQRVGIKISDFNKVREGDLVECFEIDRSKGKKPWQPAPGVFDYLSS